jgi:uncharacterized membrane protein
MSILIFGLILFLGIHSVRIVAEGWRQRRIDAMGEGGWKGAYSLVSAVGMGLIVWGFGLARAEPAVLWVPPKGMAHLAALLTLVAFVLLAAAYVPRNRIKSRLRHPMVLAVKVWALAHLLSNGNLADVLLFGSFLLWAVLSFRAARRRDEEAMLSDWPAHSSAGSTWVTVGVGAVAWAVFAFWAHGVLIGVRPFGV